MYQRMLLPLDGSELAEESLSYAKGIAGRLGLEVIMLHVAAKGQAESPMHRAYLDQVAERLRRALADMPEAAPGRRATVRGEVVAGYPSDEILRCAGDMEVDLILMTTHGRSGVRRWVLGSVADKVLRSAAQPVLLIRAGMPRDFAYDTWSAPKMLVPLDGSQLAEMVLPHVTVMASREQGTAAEIVLVGICEPLVLPPVTAPETTVNWGAVGDEYLSKCQKSTERYLDCVHKGLADAGLRVSAEVLRGDPANAIVDYAVKNQVDLIVMATHGRSGIGRWAYGSVAQKVLHGASSPILLVRPPTSPSIAPKIVASLKNLPGR